MDCLPQIHTIAIHAEAGFNTAVPGIGILCTKEDYFRGGGVYRNSIGKTSVYAQTGKYFFDIKDAQVGAMVGLATGYPLYKVVPIAGGVISLKTNATDSINLLLVPKVKNITPAFVQISYVFK